MRHPLLLLPRPIDQFVLGDHARELVEHGDGAVALPGRLPYGALTRAPAGVRGSVARSIAWGLARQIPDDWSPSETVLVAYHAIQWPAVAALLHRGVAEEVWYCRWDRYEEAQDAGRLRTLLRDWHERLAEVSELTFAVSEPLAALERDSKYLVNPGSVGQPRDADARAAYLIFDAAEQRVEMRRVDYPIERTQEKMAAAGLPEPLIRRLAAGR